MRFLPKSMRQKGSVASISPAYNEKIYVKRYGDGWSTYLSASPEAEAARAQYLNTIEEYLSQKETILDNNHTKMKKTRDFLIKAWLVSFSITSIPADLLCNNRDIANKVKEWLIRNNINLFNIDLTTIPVTIPVAAILWSACLAIKTMKNYSLKRQCSELEKYSLYMDNQELLAKYQPSSSKNRLTLETLDSSGLGRVEYILKRADKVKRLEQKRSA